MRNRPDCSISLCICKRSRSRLHHSNRLTKASAISFSGLGMASTSRGSYQRPTGFQAGNRPLVRSCFCSVFHLRRLLLRRRGSADHVALAADLLQAVPVGTFEFPINWRCFLCSITADGGPPLSALVNAALTHYFHLKRGLEAARNWEAEFGPLTVEERAEAGAVRTLSRRPSA